VRAFHFFYLFLLTPCKKKHVQPYHDVALHLRGLDETLLLHGSSSPRLRSSPEKITICTLFFPSFFLSFFFWDSLSSALRPRDGSPAQLSPPLSGSEPVRKWVGLQPSGLIIIKKEKQRGHPPEPHTHTHTHTRCFLSFFLFEIFFIDFANTGMKNKKHLQEV